MQVNLNKQTQKLMSQIWNWKAKCILLEVKKNLDKEKSKN